MTYEPSKNLEEALTRFDAVHQIKLRASRKRWSYKDDHFEILDEELTFLQIRLNVSKDNERCENVSIRNPSNI